MADIKLAFLGDISLNNKYNQLYSNGKNPFAEVQKYLQGTDLVVGNLECLAEGTCGENEFKRPRLKTKLETLNFLDSIGVNLVTLAHNHSYDNLLDGYNKTVSFLKNRGIDFIGAGLSPEKAAQPFFFQKENTNLCFLNYLDEDTHPNLPQSCALHVNTFKMEKAVADIKKYKNGCDQLIVLLHWGGGAENGYYPDFQQSSVAKILIDAGADLIVGHHSHTLQPFEVYKNKYIFYSLGNFCFSNIEFEGATSEIDWGRNAESIIMQVTCAQKEYSVGFVPIKNQDHFIRPDESIMRRWKKRITRFKILRNSRILWNMYDAMFKTFRPACFYFFGNHRNPFKQSKDLFLKKFFKAVKFFQKNEHAATLHNEK